MSPVWYILYTFNCQELKVGDYLASKGKTYFIPMMYKEKVTREGKHKRVLLPVVHNLVFLQKDDNEKKYWSSFLKVRYLYIFSAKKKHRTVMRFLIRKCLNSGPFVTPIFPIHVLSVMTRLKQTGKMVEVVHGPFKGMRGKLHRIRNQFYFIKSLAGLGVMIRISRWYCKTLD